MKKPLALLALAAFVFSGCAHAYRSDAQEARVIELGSGARILVVEDPLKPVRCYITWSGTACLPTKGESR